MKKLLIICALLFALALVGCADKEALSAAGFADLLEQAGYYVSLEDLSDDFYAQQEMQGMIYYAVADEPDGKFSIEFVVFETPEQARAIFDEGIAEMNSRSGAWFGRIESNAANYNIYRGTNNSRYYVISRIGDTMLYVDTEDEHRDAVNEILETLGYR